MRKKGFVCMLYAEIVIQIGYNVYIQLAQCIWRNRAAVSEDGFDCRQTLICKLSWILCYCCLFLYGPIFNICHDILLRRLHCYVVRKLHKLPSLWSII